MNDAQTEMGLKRIEITIVVQQPVAFLNTKRRDQAVNGLADSVTFGAQQAIVPRRGNRKIGPTTIQNRQAGQSQVGAPEILVVSNPLQHLGKCKVGETDYLERQLPL